jgi:ABC-type uncharacterized transport system
MNTDNSNIGQPAEISSSRQKTGLVLILLGAGFLALAIWWVMWGLQGRSAMASAEKKLDPKLEKLEELGAPKDKEDDGKAKPHSTDYLPAGVWAGMLGVLAIGGAFWLFTQPGPSAGPSIATVEKVTLGAVAGLLTTLLGIAFGYSWHDSLAKWISGGEKAEAKWILYAVATFVVGLVVMFVTLQSGRGEQRNNALLRRVMYGFNSVFVGILLLIVLAAANVVSFMKLPTTLVTNASAFDELTVPTKEYLKGLNQPVKIYLLLPEKQEIAIGGITYDNLYADCRGLLTQCRDVTKQIEIEYLSPAFERAKIAALMERLKINDNDRDKLGMVVSIDDSPTRTAFINAETLIDIDQRQRAIVFQGENKLITELQVLTESRTNDVIYFTQDHGELAIEPGGEPNRSISALVQFLRDKRLTVKALDLKKEGGKIPDDAGLVVVAGPQRVIDPQSPTAKALANYFSPAEPEKKPGKLLIYAPSFPAPGSNAIDPTGLEPLLQPLGISLPQRRLLLGGVRLQIGRATLPPDAIPSDPNPRAAIALAKSLTRSGILLTDCRPVMTGGPQMPGSKIQTTPLYLTPRQLPTFQEGDYKADPDLVWNQIREDETLFRKKFVNLGGIPIAVAVHETKTVGDKQVEQPRAVVFGSDSLVADRSRVPAAPDEYRQIFFGDCIDWLREREGNLGIPPKKLSTYNLDKPVDGQSQLLLLGMVTIGIVALGLGVWVSRRR